MKKSNLTVQFGLLTAAAVAVVAFSRVDAAMDMPPGTKMADVPPITKAIAVLEPTQGNTVKGTVTFTKEAGGIHVVADITNLTPGKHGFHIHQYGDCSSPDGMAAGGHFNPSGAPHAAADAMPRHAGDLGNITADDTGHAKIDVVDNLLAFEGQNSIIGRGLIVHAKADDLMTQPTGNAGGRVACGVIGIAKP